MKPGQCPRCHYVMCVCLHTDQFRTPDYKPEPRQLTPEESRKQELVSRIPDAVERIYREGVRSAFQMGSR